MSDELFPSGPWTGFYNYRPGDRHRMDLQLTFANGNLTGGGNDDVGRFLIRGRYDTATRDCHWTKSYIGRHDVFYRGFREGKGIWGTWEIMILDHGGFHIWPKQEREGEQGAETKEQPEPVDAIASKEVTQSTETISPQSGSFARTAGRALPSSPQHDQEQTMLRKPFTSSVPLHASTSKKLES